ncbi:hypothetical protein VN23_02715 [Janthinobacterium sp. B9-8]|nr:hypothetical protein VN23_02715 [Janthinobacterium sp. B9-8]
MASFLGRSRKEGPRGGQALQNQRAEGTKKVFLILVSAYGVQPASYRIKYLKTAGCTRPTKSIRIQ